MESMKGARQSKKAARILRAAYNALSRHKFVGSTYDALLFALTTRSQPYTKSSSALDYMNIV